MAVKTAEKATDTPELSPEDFGELDKEKTITKDALGGAFTFRLPYAMDDLKFLRARARIMGMAEEVAGAELRGISHALALFEIYNVHKPHGFRLEPDESGKGGLQVWDDFLEMMEEVSAWHAAFRQRLGRKEA